MRSATAPSSGREHGDDRRRRWRWRRPRSPGRATGSPIDLGDELGGEDEGDDQGLERLVGPVEEHPGEDAAAVDPIPAMASSRPGRVRGWGALVSPGTARARKPGCRPARGGLGVAALTRLSTDSRNDSIAADPPDADLLTSLWFIVLAHIIMSWLINFNVLNRNQPLVWHDLDRAQRPARADLWPDPPVPARHGRADLSPIVLIVALYALRIVIVNNAGLFVLRIPACRNPGMSLI